MPGSRVRVPPFPPVNQYLRFGLDAGLVNPCQVHSKSNKSIFAALELVPILRTAGDPLHLMAAEALVTLHTTAERLQERVYQLRDDRPLNCETIRGMQQAAAEIERAQWSRRQAPIAL